MTTNTKTKTPAVRHDIALFPYRPSQVSNASMKSRINLYRQIQNMTLPREACDVTWIKHFF